MRPNLFFLFLLISSLIFAPGPSQAWMPISHWSKSLRLLAGSIGGEGTIDGLGPAARFQQPEAVTVDLSGNIYVADYFNSTVRKITADGRVTTFAGDVYNYGSADGTGRNAQFSYVSGVAADTSGNVYAVDISYHTIRKITPAGVVTTFVGTAGSSGSADGTGAAARFYYPYGVAVDSSGNVYVADQGNFTIRKITPGGVVTTLAGSAGFLGSADGTGAAARFRNPTGVAVDSSDNVYVADSYNSTIRKITPGGVVTTFAGTAGFYDNLDGTGAAARFASPTGLSMDSSGNLYVADRDGQIIRKVTPGAVVTTIAGSAGSYGTVNGTGAVARFRSPRAISVDSSGNVYVADASESTIRKITPGGVATTFAGTAGSSGNADGTGAAARFNFPSGLAADSAGTIYVADTNNHTIRKITSAGVVTTFAGTAGSSGSADGTGAAARFSSPNGLAVDSSGNVYVADKTNHAIRKITSAGVVTTLAGTAGSSGSADGTGAAARFSSPNGLAVDLSGNVYVADQSNRIVRKITPAGVVTTLAGTAGSSGSVDGAGAVARFGGPGGVVVDSDGYLYVSDLNNNSIRKISPAGVVTTVVGGGFFSVGVKLGPLPGSLSYPTAVALHKGQLYIASAFSILWCRRP